MLEKKTILYAKWSILKKVFSKSLEFFWPGQDIFRQCQKLSVGISQQFNSIAKTIEINR